MRRRYVLQHVPALIFLKRLYTVASDLTKVNVVGTCWEDGTGGNVCDPVGSALSECPA